MLQTVQMADQRGTAQTWAEVVVREEGPGRATLMAAARPIPLPTAPSPKGEGRPMMAGRYPSLRSRCQLSTPAMVRRQRRRRAEEERRLIRPSYPHSLWQMPGSKPKLADPTLLPPHRRASPSPCLRRPQQMPQIPRPTCQSLHRPQGPSRHHRGLQLPVVGLRSMRHSLKLEQPADLLHLE